MSNFDLHQNCSSYFFSRWAKLVSFDLSYYFFHIYFRSPLSEIVAQPGTDHEEIAVGIRDVLAAGLHAQRAGELAPPRHFNGVLAALLEKGILPREATRIAAVLINAAHFTIAAASV